MKAGAGLRIFIAWAALCAPAISREPDAKEMRSFELPRFTILARDASTAGRVATLFDQADRLLAQILAHGSRTPGVPTTVVVLSPTDLDRYFGGIHAFEAAPYQSFSNTILLPDVTNGDHLRATVFHQAAHLFLRTQFTAEIPVWFSEGLALFVAPTELEGAKAVIGKRRFSTSGGSGDLFDKLTEAAFYRQPHFRQDWFDLGALLSARADSSILFPRANSFDTRRESWLLVHKAFIDNPKFKQSMFSYLEAVNAFTPVEAAVRQGFGMSVAELDRALYSYSQRENLAESTLELAPAEPVSPGEGTPISAPATLERLTNLALDSGGELEHLDELITAAARQGLDAPRVQLLRLRLAAQKHYDATLERVLAGLEQNLGEPTMARSAGLALYERDSGADKRHLGRTQELLGRALTAQPDDVQAAWLYGVVSIRLSRDLDVALLHLERARLERPENPDIVAVLATLHFMRGERESMIARLEETLRFSRSPEQRRWAARQLAAARSGKTSPVGK